MVMQNDIGTIFRWAVNPSTMDGAAISDPLRTLMKLTGKRLSFIDANGNNISSYGFLAGDLPEDEPSDSAQKRMRLGSQVTRNQPFVET